MSKILKNFKKFLYLSFLEIRNLYQINCLTKDHIYFFSESGFYKDFFEEFVLSVDIENKKCIYLTSDFDEYLYFKDKITTFYIGKGIVRQIIFSTIKCTMLVLTLTDLGNNFQISKNCLKYIYFFHSLASTHKIYKKDAFKNYDIIFCNNEYQKKELELAEQKFFFPQKKIIITGYMYLDFLHKNYGNIDNKKTVLFAPSWNYNKKNLLNEYGIYILDFLTKNKFQVIFRPHNEHYKRSKKIISEIIKKYSSLSNFYFDKEMSNMNSLKKSEILITDNSTIGMEFSLTFYKPTVYLNYTEKIHNPDFKVLNIEPLEEIFKRQLGYSLNVNNLDEIDDIYLNRLSNKIDLKNKCEEFKKKYLTNTGNSTNIASKNLISIYNNIIDNGGGN
tara:strand:- start:366 stop:1532 length:1167 start_codon:yes stop_codon:yes gene_type:complete